MKRFISLMILMIFPLMTSFAEEAKKAEKTAAEYITDLSSNDEAVAVAAEDWLGQKQEKSAVKALLQSTKSDSRERVRMNAAVAIGLIGDKTAAEQMSEIILNESSATVRYAQVLALSRLGIETQKSIDNLMAARDKEGDPFIKDFVAKLEEKFKSKK